MADLQDLGTIANDSTFQDRCMEALETYCINTVVSEGAQVGSHTQRDAFALEVIGHQNQISPLEVAEAVLSNPTIAAEAVVANSASTPSYSIPDSDIQFVITTIFNDLAGVST